MRHQDVDRTLVTIGVAAPALVSVAALFFVPKFAFMFENFDAPLGLATRFVLATYFWWGLIPLGILLVMLSTRISRQRAIICCLIGMFVATALLALGVWACYAPIFALGQGA